MGWRVSNDWLICLILKNVSTARSRIWTGHCEKFDASSLGTGNQSKNDKGFWTAIAIKLLLRSVRQFQLFLAAGFAILQLYTIILSRSLASCSSNKMLATVNRIRIFIAIDIPPTTPKSTDDQAGRWYAYPITSPPYAYHLTRPLSIKPFGCSGVAQNVLAIT